VARCALQISIDTLLGPTNGALQKPCAESSRSTLRLQKLTGP
jgi:hypothetical protein